MIGVIAQTLAGVRVSAKSIAGGQVRSAISDRNGVAVFAGLSEGSYRIDAAADGFNVSRTSVRVGAGDMAIDMRLFVRMLCECVDISPRVDLPSRVEPRVAVVGDVLDEAGHPLPHAVLHATGAGLDETSVADSDGAFEARLTRGRTVSFEVSYPGFKSETTIVSTARPASQRLSIVLRPGAAQPVSATGEVERLKQGCVCPGNLFVHKIR